MKIDTENLSLYVFITEHGDGDPNLVWERSTLKFLRTNSYENETLDLFIGLSGPLQDKFIALEVGDKLSIRDILKYQFTTGGRAYLCQETSSNNCMKDDLIGKIAVTIEGA